MKFLLALLLPCLLTVLAPSADAQTGEGYATYRVTFDATWSPSSHPGLFPGGAHFSPLIGAVHSSALELWTPGGMASNGIESMAETGSTVGLNAAVSAAVQAGTASGVIQGAGASATDSISMTITVTDDFPLASLVTMIAPSPDWFIGVHGVSMMENDAWIDQKVVSLFAYDSGTDNGSQFTSANSNTSPQQPISLITSGPLAGAAAFGTFTFERLSSALEIGICNNPPGSLALSGSTELGGTLTFAFDNPLGTTTAPAATFLGISFLAVPGQPCGITVPGLGLASFSAPGDLLLGNLNRIIVGPTWNGSPVPMSLTIPNAPVLVGVEVYAQGALVDGAGSLGATSAFRIVIGA